jgi:hypothetical protein
MSQKVKIPLEKQSNKQQGAEQIRNQRTAVLWAALAVLVVALGWVAAPLGQHYVNLWFGTATLTPTLTFTATPPFPSSTPRPTVAPSFTFTPSFTITSMVPPSATPKTIAPTPSVTSVMLPFRDNFNKELSKSWFPLSSLDKWLISNGQLSLDGLNRNQESYIFVGDKSWTDYKITLSYNLDRYAMTVSVIVRSNPPDDFGLRFVVDNYNGYWQTWDSGKWKPIGTKGALSSYARLGVISISVRGQTFSGYVDGLPISEINYPNAPLSGLVGLTSDCNNSFDCSKFDNLVIEAINH